MQFQTLIATPSGLRNRVHSKGDLQLTIFQNCYIISTQFAVSFVEDVLKLLCFKAADVLSLNTFNTSPAFCLSKVLGFMLLACQLES